MNVTSEGSHFRMPPDVATPDTVEAENRGPQEAGLARRAYEAPPDDIVTEDEYKVF